MAATSGTSTGLSMSAASIAASLRVARGRRAPRRGAGRAPSARACPSAKPGRASLPPTPAWPGGRGVDPARTGHRGCGRPATRTDRPAGWPATRASRSAVNAWSTSPEASATSASPRAEMPSQHGSPIWQARANDCSRQSAAPATSPWDSRTWPSSACGQGRNASQCSRSASSTAPSSCSAASSSEPRSRLTRPSIDRPKASRRGSSAERERRGRLLEQGRRAGVLGAVAGDGAQVGHRLGQRRRRAGALLEDLAEPPLRPVVARPEEVDVPQLGAGAGCGLAVAVGEGDPLRLDQGGHPFLVQAAQRVDERLGEHQPRLDPKASGIRLVGETDRGLEARRRRRPRRRRTTAAAPASMIAWIDASRPRPAPTRRRSRSASRTAAPGAPRAPAPRSPTRRRTAARPRCRRRPAGRAGSAVPGGSRPAGS